MPVYDANWLPLREAAQKSGESYETIRRLAKAGVFTRGIFSAATKRPPVHLNVRELVAFKAGGIDAVRRVQARAKAAKRGAAK